MISSALAVRSSSRVSVASTSATSGSAQQTLEADDLDRHAGGGEGVEDVGGVLVVANQDPDLLPRRARNV